MAGTVRPINTRNSVHIQKFVQKMQPIPPTISKVKHTKKEAFLPILKLQKT